MAISPRSQKGLDVCTVWLAAREGLAVSSARFLANNQDDYFILDSPFSLFLLGFRHAMCEWHFTICHLGLDPRIWSRSHFQLFCGAMSTPNRVSWEWRLHIQFPFQRGTWKLRSIHGLCFFLDIHFVGGATHITTVAISNYFVEQWVPQTGYLENEGCIFNFPFRGEHESWDQYTDYVFFWISILLGGQLTSPHICFKENTHLRHVFPTHFGSSTQGWSSWTLCAGALPIASSPTLLEGMAKDVTFQGGPKGSKKGVYRMMFV